MRLTGLRRWWRAFTGADLDPRKWTDTERDTYYDKEQGDAAELLNAMVRSYQEYKRKVENASKDCKP